MLEDVRREAPDLIVVGGDLASGPLPRETLDRLIALGDGAQFIRGNADRELLSHGDGASERRARADAADIWVRRDAWAARQLTDAQRSFLAGLPETVMLELDGLGRTLFCHGSPRSDEERVTRLTPERRLLELVAGVEETTIVCGHTHMQFDRSVDGKRIVNAGSVGMPYERAAAAYWALLGPEVSFRRTDYDVAGAAARFRASAFPEADEFTEGLLDPPDPDETSAFFEQIATNDRGRG